MTSRQLEGFVIAAELLSFTRAAQRLHMTQPAFSQLIRELEAGMEVKLFERTTRRVSLTAAGQVFYERVQGGVRSIFEAYENARAVARAECGHLSVGSLQSLAIGLVIQALGDFRRSSPGVTVSLREDYNGALYDHVLRGELDFAVCAHSTKSNEIAFDELFEEELVVVMPYNHPLSQNELCRWHELQSEQLILMSHQSSTREQIAEAFAANHIVEKGAYDVASMFTALGMVREGFGVTLLPVTVLPEVNMLDLTTRRLKGPTPMRRIGVCRRTDRVLSPAAIQFKALLQSRSSKLKKVADGSAWDG
ncbi:LysR family transcriptional regulator [Pusillimonas sp. SM2304]|uniref:LysR family transcriptional regulator n=1 Tax=Pusillimonas sp. SM2304 TaxID=3073241 RepID=UPI00287576C0|nr:LysR family transcriptional regulator [Pusillimonas sp. SM2304]MDS1140628.1 LysR family transcriptional regulator [Pusillimonas sp. SM2304]